MRPDGNTSRGGNPSAPGADHSGRRDDSAAERSADLDTRESPQAEYLVPGISNMLAAALAASASRHDHLCPRQVLGVRIGLHGGARLGLDVPRSDKRLLVIVESDGCFSDGIAVATGCEIGHRTLRVADYGKIAATFVDCEDGRAYRIRPQLDVRQRVKNLAVDAESRWHAYVSAYQRMSDEELLDVEEVRLVTPIAQIVSHPNRRVLCGDCGEEVSNEREVVDEGRPLCRTCAERRGISRSFEGTYYLARSDVLPST